MAEQTEQSRREAARQTGEASAALAQHLDRPQTGVPAEEGGPVPALDAPIALTPARLPAAIPFGALPAPASELGEAARRVDAAWTSLLQHRSHDDCAYDDLYEDRHYESLDAALRTLARVAAEAGLPLDALDAGEYALAVWHLAAGHLRAIARDGEGPPSVAAWSLLPEAVAAWSVEREDDAR